MKKIRNNKKLIQALVILMIAAVIITYSVSFFMYLM